MAVAAALIYNFRPQIYQLAGRRKNEKAENCVISSHFRPLSGYRYCIKDNGKIDPCCGGGGMLVAGLDVLANDYHVNYARNVFISAADIDIRCVHMTYLQLSLAGVLAIVRHRNSLSMECWSVWKTPAYILQYPRFCKYEAA